MASRARGVAVAAAAVAAALLVPSPAGAAPPPSSMHVMIRHGVARAGQPTGIVGHLLRGRNDAYAGEPVTLWSSPDYQAWTQVASGSTDAQGGAAFTVTPAETLWYRITHEETDTAAAAEGGARIVVTDEKEPPDPPERVAAGRGDASVRVSWLPPPDDGGSAVTSYTVRAKGDSETVTVTRPASARTATVTGLRNDERYLVSVTARTVLGSATTTRDGYVVPRRGVPAPPSGGTHVCGRLPFGTTRWTAAGSPYVVCPAGVVVPLGATLQVDGAEARFRGLPWLVPGEPYGLEVRGGTLRVTGSTLRGESGRPGEWRGVLADAREAWPAHYGITGTAVAFAGSTVRDAVDAVRLPRSAAVTALTDTVLADGSGAGLRAATAVRAARLTVRDVGGDGVSVDCGVTSPAFDPNVTCPVALDDVTVRRAGGRGLTVETPDAVSVHGSVVAGSGTAAPTSEAARFSGMTAALGADIGDVTGGGNGIDAVVLDFTLTNDLTWRTPVARATTAPAPLGYLVRNLRMAAGRGITFPAGSVVKGVPAPYDCRVTYYEHERRPCAGSIEITGAALRAAPGTVFTGAADPSAGVPTCPSALAPACGATGPWWSGILVRGESEVSLAGATVRGAARGLDLHYGNSPGIVATVAGATFDRNGVALSAIQGNRGGSMTLADVTVTDSARSIEVAGFGEFTATGVSVRRSGGVVLAAGHANGGCGPTASRFSVDGLTVEDAPGPGLTVTELCHPKVRGVVVRRSGRPRGAEAIGQPAVKVDAIATYGPGKDIEVPLGGGNGIDAVAVSGWSQGDLVWVSPSNSAGDHPLGYLLGGALYVTGAGAVTFPADALVAGVDGASLSVRGPAFDARAGGARFVSVYDAPLGCRSGCGPRKWGTVGTSGPLDNPQGDAHVAGATLRGATLYLVRDAFGHGEVSVTSTTSDSDLTVYQAARATVTDSTFAAIRVGYATTPVVERNNVPVADGVIQVYGGGSTPLVLKDNHVAAGTKDPAYLLGNVRATFGPGGTVSGNIGAGGNAVLALGGVETDADLDWVTPTDDPEPHPVGYVVMSHQSGQSPARGLTVLGAHTLRVPAGGVVKADHLTVEGALDATAGGVVITPPADRSVGVRTCDWASAHQQGCWDNTTASHPVRTWLKGGALGIRGARLYAYIDAGTMDGRAVTRPAPGETGFGVAIKDSHVDGVLRTANTAVTVTGTTFARGGIATRYGSGHVLRDVRLSAAAGPALVLVNAPADVREVEVSGSLTAPELSDRGAVQVAGASGGSVFSCLDVRGNGGGFATADTAVTVTDSTLDGNAPGYDLDNGVAVTTTGVWWGQPGGPAPGQVRDPAKHADNAPAAAAPACAKAETQAPPSPPRAVAAVPGDHSVVATWQAPTTDGGAPVTGYVVTARPGDASVTTGPGARSAVVPGLTPGRAYAVTVTAVNAVARSGPSPAATARAGAGPAFAVFAPGVVTYDAAALVTGRLTSLSGDVGGRRVRLYVRRNGATAWNAPIALTTSPEGSVSYRLPMRASTQVRLVWPGDATLGAASSAVRTIALRPVITATLSRASAPEGVPVTLSGGVAPGFAGRRVRLQRLTVAGWQDVTYATLSSASTYRFTLRRPRGRYEFRVTLVQTLANARAESPARTLTVT